MGTFFVEAIVADPKNPERREPLKLLVDSGSTYTWVSSALLRQLGVEPAERRRILTIEGKTVERGAIWRSLAPTRWKASALPWTPSSGVSSLRYCLAPPPDALTVQADG